MIAVPVKVSARMALSICIPGRANWRDVVRYKHTTSHSLEKCVRIISKIFERSDQNELQRQSKSNSR